MERQGLGCNFLAYRGEVNRSREAIWAEKTETGNLVFIVI